MIDSHAHLTFPELLGQVDDVIARSCEAGVERVITIGVNLEDARAAAALASKFPSRVYAGAGFHPHEAEKVGDADLSAIAEIWDLPSIVALGEIGLDYHYDFADREIQRNIFRAQLELARSRDKPVVIHSREALPDTVSILLEHGFADRPVVFHCFTGTADEAAHIARHGWRISFTGIVTFRRSTELQAIAKAYPGDALMIESDSPYLSPEPLRGKHPNEPARVALTARFLADLRGIEYREFAGQTSENTRSFFRLP